MARRAGPIFGHPSGLVFDNAGNLYIAASGNRSIRRVDTNGIITTIAGTGEHGYSGDGGPAVRAQLAWTRDVAVDDNGNVYIADYSNARIRRVDAGGIITTIAGTGEHDYRGDGGPAVQAQLRSPEGVAVDRAGNLLIADTNNNRIRRVDARGFITTLVGGGIGGDHGPAVQAQLKSPVGVAVDGAGNLLIADGENYRIRRVDSKGIITTIAGTGALGFSGGPCAGSRSQDIPAFRRGAGPCWKRLHFRFQQQPHPPGGCQGGYHHRCRNWGSLATAVTVARRSRRGYPGPTVSQWTMPATCMSPIKVAIASAE